MAPLVSSTLTTVVVFAPLGLLSGVAGQFFRALSLSLSVAVLLSLALSVTVVPLLARWAFRAPSSARRAARESRLERVYGRVARRRWCGIRVAAIVVAVLLAASTVGLFYSIGTGFLPPADEGGFVIDYLTPAGTRARRDRPRRCARWRRSSQTRRKWRRTRGAPDRSSACSRRRRTPATSWCG